MIFDLQIDLKASQMIINLQINMKIEHFHRINNLYIDMKNEHSINNCQNDDSETIKKKKRTLFRRRKFDELIESI